MMKQQTCATCGRKMVLIYVEWFNKPQWFWRHIGNQWTGGKQPKCPKPQLKAQPS